MVPGSLDLHCCWLDPRPAQSHQHIPLRQVNRKWHNWKGQKTRAVTFPHRQCHEQSWQTSPKWQRAVWICIQPLHGIMHEVLSEVEKNISLLQMDSLGSLSFQAAGCTQKGRHAWLLAPDDNMANLHNIMAILSFTPMGASHSNCWWLEEAELPSNYARKPVELHSWPSEHNSQVKSPSTTLEELPRWWIVDIFQSFQCDRSTQRTQVRHSHLIGDFIPVM